MLKKSLLYFLLSALLVTFSKYAHMVIVYIDILYTYTNVKLAPIFSNTETGVLIRNTLTLTLLPVLITAVPALIYRGFKKKLLPYYYELTWFVWLIIMLSNILIT